MKKLKFTFIDGDDELINAIVPYKKEKEGINFNFDNVDYYFNLDNNFSFIRTNKNDQFGIYIDNGMPKAYYKLIDENIEVDIKVLNFNISFEDKKCIIKYNIESDEKKVKSIILSFT